MGDDGARAGDDAVEHGLFEQVQARLGAEDLLLELVDAALEIVQAHRVRAVGVASRPAVGGIVRRRRRGRRRRGRGAGAVAGERCRRRRRLRRVLSKRGEFHEQMAAAATTSGRAHATPHLMI